MNESTSLANGLLVLPHRRIQNANAISGPLTWGFPAPTAFTGFAHALQRRLSALPTSDDAHLEQGFSGIGIICHHSEAQVAQPAGKGTQVFRLTRNPLFAGWKKFEDKIAALVEEGRIHLEVTLVIAVKDYLPPTRGEIWAAAVAEIVQGMRLAGGSFLPAATDERSRAQWHGLSNTQDEHDRLFRRLRQRWLPGFALVQRDDLLLEHLAALRAQHPEANTLDALLDLCRLNFEPGVPVDGGPPEQVNWQVRKHAGWLVPLPIGYAGLSPLYAPGTVAHARDVTTPLRFVESLYTLGEWRGPHRLQHLEQLLWHSEAEPENGLYACRNHFSTCQSTVKETY